MERELWSIISGAITDVSQTRKSAHRFTYDVALIARVYLWSVLHDRPVNWACRRSSWSLATGPSRLPNQSTMSRRLPTEAMQEFLQALGRRLSGDRYSGLVKMIDGKPMPIARHSQDRDATFGRGAGGLDKGYKLHALWGRGNMPLAWSVKPMNVHEKVMAAELFCQLRDGGYILADANYEASHLHELAASHNHQLLSPRQHPGSSLGHRRHSQHRLRAIQLLEGPSRFGQQLYQLRREIEGRFSGLTSFGGGLVCLPPWVRHLHRVERFVHAKLLINAARIIRLKNQRGKQLHA